MLPYSIEACDKSQWPRGVWDVEPDVIEGEAFGLHLAILRMPWSGQLNGYVRVPVGHPLYNKEYGDKVSTPAGALQREVTLGQDIGFISYFLGSGQNLKKKIPLELLLFVHGGLTYSAGNEAKGWWFGFDTHHSGDKVPTSTYSGTYRNMFYVQEQCERLAKQISEFFPWPAEATS